MIIIENLEQYVVVDFEGNLVSNNIFKYFSDALDFVDEVYYTKDNELIIITVDEFNDQNFHEVGMGEL